MPTYSHSRISTFEQCPLKYKYHYLDALSADEELEGIEAFLGSRFHDTMEWLYAGRKLSKERTLDEALEHFGKIWRENWHDDIRIVREGFDAKDYYTHGEKMLRSYYKRVFANDDSTTIALERMMVIKLDGYALRGRIDRLAFRDGAYEVHDYKTSGYLPTKKDIENDRQLALYQMAVKEEYADVKRVKLVWHYAAFDKDITVEKSEKELHDVKKEILAAIKEIEQAKEFPANKSALCDWCGFRPLCPMWKHAVKAELLPENEFLKEPGVVLATKYAALKEEERELGEKLKKVREAIIAYAKKEGLQVIVGKDCRVSVKIVLTERLPPKGTGEREKLEELIRKSGRWVEVSEISAALLKKAAAAGLFEEKTATAIQNLKKMEEIALVRVSQSDTEKSD